MIGVKIENEKPVNISIPGTVVVSGNDGTDGKDGHTPIKGVDYFDGKDGKDGKDGSDASVTAENIKNALGFEPAKDADATKLKQDLAQLETKKVGYSEVQNGQLLMYSDESKEHLLATLDLPTADLSDYVKNTDYASGSNAGIIKGTTSYDATVTSSGYLQAQVRTKEAYEGRSQYAFLSKGTFENIIPSKVAENLPVASPDKLGLVTARADQAFGVYIGNNGQICIAQASESNIDARTSSVAKILTVSKLDHAVKAALTDGKGAAYTDAEKSAALERIGAQPKEKEWVLKGTMTLENASAGVNVDLTGCTELVIKGEVVATGASYIYSIPSNKILVDGFSTSGNRSWFNYFSDVNGDLVPIVSKYENVITKSIHVNQNAYLTIDYALEHITAIKLSRVDTITSLNVEIWAR